MVLVLGGCADDNDAGSHASAPAAADAPRASEGLANGDVAAVLQALHQSHARVRGAIGPHQLIVKARFDLAPQGDPATAEPALDELRPRAEHIEDVIELQWLTASPNVPRFSLSQSNDHQRGRDVVVDGERIYTRQANRTWYVGPLQADVYELWLDDAQRAVYDAVALAAPQLAIAVAPGADGQLRLALSRTGSTNAALVRDDPRSAWRSGATIDEIGGTIDVDGGSGAWLSADVQVAYSMPGPDGRVLRGSVALEARRTALGADAPLGIPQDAQPLLERTRYDAERARLLDGLAGR